MCIGLEHGLGNDPLRRRSALSARAFFSLVSLLVGLVGGRLEVGFGAGGLDGVGEETLFDLEGCSLFL